MWKSRRSKRAEPAVFAERSGAPVCSLAARWTAMCVHINESGNRRANKQTNKPHSATRGLFREFCSSHIHFWDWLLPTSLVASRSFSLRHAVFSLPPSPLRHPALLRSASAVRNERNETIPSIGGDVSQIAELGIKRRKIKGKGQIVCGRSRKFRLAPVGGREERKWATGREGPIDRSFLPENLRFCLLYNFFCPSPPPHPLPVCMCVLCDFAYSMFRATVLPIKQPAAPRVSAEFHLTGVHYETDNELPMLAAKLVIKKITLSFAWNSDDACMSVVL